MSDVRMTNSALVKFKSGEMVEIPISTGELIKELVSAGEKPVEFVIPDNVPQQRYRELIEVRKGFNKQAVIKLDSNLKWESLGIGGKVNWDDAYWSKRGYVPENDTENLREKAEKLKDAISDLNREMKQRGIIHKTAELKVYFKSAKDKTD